VIDSFTLQRTVLRALSPRGRRARLLIFTFHRVLSEPDPLFPDEPDARLFATMLDWIGSLCRVLPLPEAVRGLMRGVLPDRAACITFDDGYANNFEVALPLLEQRGMPATIFIAVDAVRRGIMWNDLIIEAVRRAPEELERALAYERGRVDRGDCTAASYVQNGRCAADARLGHVGGDGSGEGGHAYGGHAASLSRVLEHFKYLTLEARWQHASELFARVAGTAPPRLMMTPETVSKLPRHGIDVGAHTVNHPILKGLPAERARAEIAESHAWVADVAGIPPTSFAYPNGRPNRDYDASHVAMVRDAGFDLAVTTHWGGASRNASPYELPRIAPWDRTPNRFSLRLIHTLASSYRSDAGQHAES